MQQLSLSLPFAHSTLTRREVKESASSLLSPREKQSLPRAKGDEGMLLANHLGNTFPAPLRERRCGTRVHASGSCNTPSRISLPLCELRSHDTTSSLRLSLRFPFLCLSLSFLFACCLEHSFPPSISFGSRLTHLVFPVSRIQRQAAKQLLSFHPK